jgi:hypothetical protein
MKSFVLLISAAAMVYAFQAAAYERLKPVSSPLLLAQGSPPYSGCVRKCSRVQKCTSGGTERRGSELIRKPDVCKTEEVCGWECPSRR